MRTGQEVIGSLADIIRAKLPTRVSALHDLDRAIPKLAKDHSAIESVHEAIREVPTAHKLVLGDARELNDLRNESVHLIVTSPPYWTLKDYPRQDSQLGSIEDYDEFVHELGKVWSQSERLLVQGGRLVIVVGDVLLSRRTHGRHMLMPLHASIQESCRRIGLDNLAPIIWHKISNVSLEVDNGSRFLGKPYEPNAIVKHDIEYILMQRKPGAYRSPSPEMRLLSVISDLEHSQWFQQVWSLPGTSTRGHPAPFPLEIAERLIRMFSFVGDTVLDPFVGSGTTSLAASLWGRNSIGVEINPQYLDHAYDRLASQHANLFSRVSIDLS